MTRAWWDSPGPAVLKNGVPVLMPGGRDAAIATLEARIAGYVPEWRDLGEEDAGVALVRLFGLQLEPILSRLERLPEKALVEVLRTAGITCAPSRSAQTVVEFVPRENNTGTVEVPEGTHLLSPRADGEKGDVTWETDGSLSVPNVTLMQRYAFDGEISTRIDSDAAFAAFGDRPAINAAFYMGFSAIAASGSELSLYLVPASDGAPAPVAEGGARLTGPEPIPGLRWEALTDQGFVQVDVASDDTASLTRTGIVKLALPTGWQAGRPTLLGEGDGLYWVRLRLASGAFNKPPRIASIHLHTVPAIARKTQRNEFPVAETQNGIRLARLAHTPVLAGSVVLEIDEGATGGSLFALTQEESDTGTAVGGFRRWKEVETLAGQHPDARVFVLDALSGTLTFGDNIEGLQPPAGIRNIAVRSYATTLGDVGNVSTGQVARMAVQIAGIDGVANPLPASGGAATETAAEATDRGPGAIKARNRAVSTDDVALQARMVSGANISKAFAISAADPAYPGAVRPGSVAVFVIPQRQAYDPSASAPVASSETLGAVARHLAHATGPLGARICVANPRYQQVRIEASVSSAQGGSAAAAASAVRAALDNWLNPESGNWRIGATLRHADLVHVVLNADPAIIAVPFLAITLDGIAHPACQDIALARFGLPWPGRHRLVVETGEVAP